MNFKKLILAFTFIILGCSKKEKTADTSEVRAKDSIDILSAQQSEDKSGNSAQLNYEKSRVYRSSDSDSLLMEINDLKQLIESFKKKAREVKKKEFGGGDYYGKYRIYALNLDTLVIMKGDAGEYGFDNEQYLIRKDSLVFAREYSLETLLSRQGVDSITEEVTRFKNKSMIFARRFKIIPDLSNVYLGNAKFDTISENPSTRYRALRERLRHINELELIDD